MENLSPRHSYEEPPQPRVMVGRYSIECVIGRGGMGEVLKGIDPGTGKYIAVKVLDAEAARDADLLARFRREAQSALSLDHPNIAKFYGLEYDDDGLPLIVMEFIEGDPLDRWSKQYVDAPFSTIVDFVIQAARGLENAFRRSIIHRDIKPSNIIVTPDNVIKIIDFGLAKSLWDTSGLTGTGMVVGTPRYISPEQGMGRSVDHRSDIYSLGATFYELLTHQSPFDGDSPLSIMMKHINTPLVPPYMVNPKVPGDINEIVLRMMAKDPNQRYQDYEPLIRDLESAKIHRLSKERRHAEFDEAGAGQAATLKVDTAAHSPQAAHSTIAQSRPSSYLTEGLINVSYDAPAEVQQSNLTKILLTASGVIILLIALAALLAPREVEGKKSQSWLAKKVSSAIKKPEEKAAEATPADLAAEDSEKVQLTSSRMEAVLSKVLEERAGNPGKDITMRTLRAGGMSEDETQDAWGNDFYMRISGDGSGGALLSKGRDGEENSGDEFRYALDGSKKDVPAALTEDDFKSDDAKK